MRSPTLAVLSSLRASLASESSILLSTPQRLSSYLRHHHRTPVPIESLSRRHQSTSTSQSNTREDINPPPQTHYTFFPTTLPSGPPPSGNFTIDLSSLKKEFLQLQSRAHPDLHPASQKNKAQAASARINEAYKTLQSPLRRAQYLLSLKGIDVVEDETAKIEDPELLMEVMEMQEEIEEAETEQDLEGMKRHNDGRIERSVENLEEAFKRDDIQSAKNEAVRLRYWINIKESLDGWEKGKPISLEH